ncbi:MAG TPA: hypothetical protein VM140_11785 [Burkholderiales bacterium]|nr:hypothetical protein [Burkholderiales bacterium]
MSVQQVFKADLAKLWTRERIGRLSALEIKQLRANAERLNEPELAVLCSEVLKDSPRAPHASREKSTGRTKARKLVARVKAFEARGVWLQDPLSSWSGVRKSDGAIVMAIWADAIESIDGACRCLLWAPNVDGGRPWSDRAAGLERLEHCKRAMELGAAEGLLVYGQRFVGQLPEDKAYAIHGVDAETVVHFRVEAIDEQFWAIWGRKAAVSSFGQS